MVSGMIISEDTIWSNRVQRIGSNIVVEKGATLTIDNCMLYLYGYSFKVYGDLKVNDSTIKMPYVTFAYGFGGDLKGKETNNGNITISDSFIDVPCFYSFFNRQSTVTLKNSIFSGFGRIAGSESEAYNCTFLNSHDRYGSIATYGEVKQIAFCAAIGETSLYYNPNLSQNCVIENMLITGKNLAYLEPTGDYTLTLVDCEIMNRDLIDNGFTGTIEIAYEIEVSGELVRDDGVVYTGLSRVVTEYYRDGSWQAYNYSMLDNPVDIDGKNKFVNPASAQRDGFVEQSDMVGGNHIVDLVPIDETIEPANGCPSCGERQFYPRAYVLNDRWYQNKCRTCKQYALLDTTDSLMYALEGDYSSKGLLKGKPDA